MMRRKIFDFLLFFVAGIAIGVLSGINDDDAGRHIRLVNVSDMVPVCMKDTVFLNDSSFNRVGLLYPTAVVYLEKPFQVRDRMIRVHVYGWIYYENIYNTGMDWLVLKDENIRTRNNFIRIGRVLKNIRLNPVYSPEGFIWNLVSYEGFVPIGQIRSYFEMAESSTFRHRAIVVTTDLTKEGIHYPERRFDHTDTNWENFIKPLFFVIVMIALYFYFTKTGRMRCPGQWILLLTDISGFVIGISITMLL